MAVDNEKNGLEEELEIARREISSDGYPMSIGELTNLYKDGELNIRPEFQRLYRWSSTQKSRLVESLLLGIPLPSIFVSQSEDGTWELVDGLQRISTLLELQGELRDPDGTKRPMLKLEGTKYLPALEGVTWDDGAQHSSFTGAQRLDMKRSKIDVKILKRDSSTSTKFDLFQRLNSYGSILTAQEIRGALLVAASPDFYAWVQRLAEVESYRETVKLNERLIDEKFDVELVLRFLVLHNWPNERLRLKELRDFSVVLDDASVALAESFDPNSDRLGEVFEQTFDVIAHHGGEDLFRRWDSDSDEFRGSFLNTAFEVFALGLGYCIANSLPYRRDLLAAAKEFWISTESGFATGKSTEARLVRFVPRGRELVRDWK